MMAPPDASPSPAVEIPLPTAPPPPQRSSRPQTYLGKLILQMETCLTELNAKNVTYPHLETMAVSIHGSMSNSSRNYHSVQHVFDISRELTDPISVLSAFFHDCIYYHVDGGLTADQAGLLKGIFHENPDGSHTFTTSSGEAAVEEGGDRLVPMVECIFGLPPNTKVTAGLNEFLSAVIAVRSLQVNLPLEQLAQIACCIEATIPFRPVDKETGETMSEHLFTHMQEATQRFHLDFTEEDLIHSVQRACILANNDVGNFGSKDLHWFLDNTWSLLPETNETLRQQYLYTVKEFHLGIFKMAGFFNYFIRAEVVFQSFRGVPNEDYMTALQDQCRRNLIVGKKYVGAKLLAMSVLAAFAELTGGDAPMSLFMGDLPSRHHQSTTIEESLPFLPAEELVDIDRDVYNLLAVGRRSETSFDIRQSPLAAYLYGRLGDEGLTKALGVTKLSPMEKENAIAFLSALPRDVVEIIAQNMQMVALSRSDLIEAVVDQLPPPPEKNPSP
jgi:hypothetical protein